MILGWVQPEPMNPRPNNRVGCVAGVSGGRLTVSDESNELTRVEHGQNVSGTYRSRVGHVSVSDTCPRTHARHGHASVFGVSMLPSLSQTVV